jgi:hypothetical protein
MQFALFNIKDQYRLLAATEYQTLETYSLDQMVEQPEPVEREGGYTLVYGSYLPQSGVAKEKALEDLLEARDKWLSHVRGQQIHPIGLKDIEAYSVQQVGKQVRIPFSALIVASPELIRCIGSDSAHSIAAYLKFGNTDPFFNILNRPGVIALKGVERRVKEVLTPENWKAHTDQERAKRTASKIH